jgi:hypothetical protein
VAISAFNSPMLRGGRLIEDLFLRGFDLIVGARLNSTAENVSIVR